MGTDAGAADTSRRRPVRTRLEDGTGKVMEIQWYPGHMTKARRAMQEDVKLVDLLIEVVDARAPISSRNPDIDSLGAGRARLILLNKADLASEAANTLWERWFTEKGYTVVKADSRSSAQMKKVNAAVQEACARKRERDRRRGITGRPVRAMVVGIPNVGKSTFINSFAGKACAKTGNKPGVTKGNQWIRLNKTLELLDTPGLLWPKFEDPQVGLHLAMIGSVNDRILNQEELALELIRFMGKWYPDMLEERYGFARAAAEGESGDGAEPLQAAVPGVRQARAAAEGENERSAGVSCGNGESEARQILRQIAVRRGCLQKGGELDYARAGNLLLDDFRSGRLGRITLEFPPDTCGVYVKG